MARQSARTRGRTRGRRETTGVERLAAFLHDPRRPPDTLRYHELQGFLFAVASSPEMVRPSEWMPIIFNDQPAGYETLEEAQAILPELMSLYNAINASVASDRAALPADCRFRRTVMANFEDDAPIALWSRGFVVGHEWLEEVWDPWLPDELDQEFGLVLMTLTFYSSRPLANAYLKELRRKDLTEAATLFRRAFPDAVAQYAHLGRSIDIIRREQEMEPPPPAQTKVGRNDPCTCGSGRKYKKCCGATAH